MIIIAFRKRVKPSKDKQFFRNTAQRVRAINLSPAPQRGGTRL